jgi:hypothetical protein
LIYCNYCQRAPDKQPYRPSQGIVTTTENKMKIKSILLASMLMSAGFVAQGAYAADINNTAAVNLTSDGSDGFNAHYGASFTGAQIGQTFTDMFKFTLATGFDSSASVTSSYLNSKTVKDLDITGFSLDLINPVTNAIITTYAGTNITAAGVNQTDNWQLTAMGLSAGTYVIEVAGKVVGNGGGAFGSDLTISPSAVAAVPEPETYGMMLGGLGLIGFIARRRKAAKA